jgi:purine-binding chemotaxis protein CheW
MSTQNTNEKATYLTFKLDSETFAIQVANVREVLDLAEVTRVPRTPDFMRGVINLRGGVVPVVDMRKKFNLPDAEDTVDTCIIVVEVNVDGDAMVIGALADSVQEVFELADDQIEPPPSIGTRLDTEFITGMGKQGEQFTIILDIDKVFSVDELTLFTDTNADISTDADEPDPGSPPENADEDTPPAENAAV